MAKIKNWSKSYEDTDGVTYISWNHDDMIEKQAEFMDEPLYKIRRGVSVSQAGKNLWEVEYFNQKREDGEATALTDKRIGRFNTRKKAEKKARSWMKSHPNPDPLF